MSSRLYPVSAIHRFLLGRMAYPIFLCSILALAMYYLRTLLSQRIEYDFLPWNLFLAAIPYGFSLIAWLVHKRYQGRWWLLLAPFLLWLIFFPNAPYLVTDLLHLDPEPPIPPWYDIALFATFVWTGCLLSVISLNIMHSVVENYVGSVAGWLFVAATIVLSGLGIYLGRFLNWNSWDLLLDPQGVLGDVLFRLIHPIRFVQIYSVTLLFAAFLLVCYLTFMSVQRREGK